MKIPLKLCKFGSQHFRASMLGAPICTLNLARRMRIKMCHKFLL
jgi:hypothetical protein